MTIEIDKPDFFDLNLTMDSEQCPASFFFWKRKGSGEYSRLCRKGSIFYELTLSQSGEKLLIDLQPQKDHQIDEAVPKHAQKLIMQQFRFDDDFSVILEGIKQWPEIDSLFNAFPGLRLMRDTDLFPRICDSICSQNTSITQLNKVMGNIAKRFGKQVTFEDGSVYHTIPTSETLSQVSLTDLQACKLGYRAKYVLESSKILVGSLDSWNDLDKLPLDEAKSKVESLPGVGPKVAGLILMFGISRTDVFPVDLWIRRGLNSLYGWEGTPKSLQEKAEKKFHHLSSYVNNVIFYAYRKGATFTQLIGW